VSGIWWKRLESNMLLQVDATIVYLTGKKSTAITKEELAIDSKYNTYKYKGLPPGPISNPGLDSIIAAIYPINTKYWFYLSAKTGETIFSSTYQEHLLAREEYLK
ncbi:MAG: endolytic transglycosylase MltG, partial [Candidatus Pacebacteria bacterium]|nr:endolytic transglycosylase MltG [Candidatus Paceibacterota bacterium]